MDFLFNMFYHDFFYIIPAILFSPSFRNTLFIYRIIVFFLLLLLLRRNQPETAWWTSFPPFFPSFLSFLASVVFSSIFIFTVSLVAFFPRPFVSLRLHRKSGICTFTTLHPGLEYNAVLGGGIRTMAWCMHLYYFTGWWCCGEALCCLLSGGIEGRRENLGSLSNLLKCLVVDYSLLSYSLISSLVEITLIGRDTCSWWCNYIRKVECHTSVPPFISAWGMVVRHCCWAWQPPTRSEAGHTHTRQAHTGPLRRTGNLGESEVVPSAGWRRCPVKTPINFFLGLGRK